MSPMIKILKKQGIKAALPLLLLATACGEGNSPSAVSSDVEAPSSGDSELVVANAEEMPGAVNVDSTSLLDSAVVPSTDDADDTDVMAAAKSASFVDTATKVPEPATLTGLAVVALGLGAVKRRRTA